MHQQSVVDLIRSTGKKMKRKDADGEVSYAEFMVCMGGGESGFNRWLADRINRMAGAKGWQQPMHLLRTYHLYGKDPGIDRAKKVRAEIRAVIELWDNGEISFTGSALNIAQNKKILAYYISTNATPYENAVLKAQEYNQRGDDISLETSQMDGKNNVYLSS